MSGTVQRTSDTKAAPTVAGNYTALILSPSGEVLQKVCKSTEQQAWTALKRIAKGAPKDARAALRKEVM